MGQPASRAGGRRVGHSRCRVGALNDADGTSAPAAGNDWNNPPARPTPPNQDWGAPAPAGAYDSWKGFGNAAYADNQSTYVLRPTSNRGKPKLVVREGKEQGRSYDLRKDRITIGRSRESDVFLDDLQVSRIHATINRQPNGRYLLHDENSANGTIVNDQRISQHVLDEEDEIKIGQTLFVFGGF